MSIPASRLSVRSTDAGARVALETAVLSHGLPRDAALRMASALPAAAAEGGAQGAFVGVVEGAAVAGMSHAEIEALFEATDAGKAAKINAANLGLALSLGWTGGTTVSASLEIAAAAGLRALATGGVGGAHRRSGEGALDVSADLLALSRFPLAVVCSGAKSILDAAATREALETLGVAVVGWRTDAMPGFYLRESSETVDARFDDLAELAAFVRMELARASRAIIVANPIPEESAVDPAAWSRWLREAEKRVRKRDGASRGRDATPALLAELAAVSGGATVAANEALLLSNARLAGELARALVQSFK